jgi:hypothetical protein
MIKKTSHQPTIALAGSITEPARFVLSDIQIRLTPGFSRCTNDRKAKQASKVFSLA